MPGGAGGDANQAITRRRARRHWQNRTGRRFPQIATDQGKKAQCRNSWDWAAELWSLRPSILLARMFHELMSRDREDGRATGQPQGVGSEAYLNGTSQGPTSEDARKDGQIRGRSKRFMKYPG
jgi:hypothetical protein